MQIENVTITTNSPSRLQTTAIPECFVDIYPFEGGPFTFTSDTLLAVETSKNIKENVGTFEISLAPETLSQNMAWAEIITPMSFVVIGMRRGQFSNIVMVGYALSVTEEQRWDESSPVERVATIHGVDMAYLFTLNDFYSLWYLAAANKAALGITGAGLLYGDPGDVGNTWYSHIMTGGVFKDSYVPYKNAAISVQAALGTRFDKYDAIIPYGDYFLGSNGAWFNKFRQIFPFPFYEFFVTTDSTGAYNALGGTAFTSQGLGSSITGTPVVIARLNPVPALVSSVANGKPSFDSIDTSLWQSLSLSDLQNAGAQDSGITFSEAEAHNFYTINPIWLSGLNGEKNGNIRQFLFNYAAVVDYASINRYGYRPMQADTVWLADLQGSFAASNTTNLPQLMATLLGRFCGYYEATVLMGKTVMETWLRPDLQIGNRFTYQPFKNNTSWDFYIEGIRHSWKFGGPSSTQVLLTRGLPQAVYAENAAKGLLYNIHIGNAQRKNGQYISGLPKGSAAPLTALTPQQFATWMSQLDQVYITAQAVKP